MLTAPKEENFSAPMVWTDECVLPLAASGVYPKTRVWGSREKMLPYFGATAELRIELRWDGLGSVTSLSSAAGSIANTYDSFGKLTASTGSLVNPFQYTARESDTETGLYYYRARYYDTSAARFLAEDPIRFRGGINFYSYVHNRAPNLRDPRGRAEGGGGIGGSLAGGVFVFGGGGGRILLFCW